MYQINGATVVRALSLALIVAALGCKKNDATVADTAAMVPAPPAVVVLKVAGIETGKGINADKTVKDDAHDFGVRDTVYASVKTEGAGSGKLAAKWTYQDGQVVGESTQDIAPPGDANHEFHIQKATRWPKGDYKVEIMLDGVSVGFKDFTIK
ncbi:MAG: hypothetical protein ABI681_09045 [Gemmatimonadales bacterium]